ncbi:MAG: metallopeptidase TldD-related protein [Thiogranum sp.]|nr:metallopeptidase TldD-related protein [Thiogranum sp.]
MEQYFRQLSSTLFTGLAAGETLLLNYQGEDSDFVRLNHNRIRQVGHVRQQSLQLDLIHRSRETSATLQLSGRLDEDSAQAQHALSRLREQLPLLPEDPHLNYAAEIHNSIHHGENHLPAPDQALEQLMTAAQGLDLAGSWAGGEMSRGFANSLGQFNWHRGHNFNLDWSIYREGDQAVKQNYAGFEWNDEFLAQKIACARETLALLGEKPRQLKPGKYRVFLTPGALNELMDMVSWGGFGLKSHRTAQTPLLKMVREEARLHDTVTISENHADGFTPRFTRAGFVKPDQVALITEGQYRGCLANARSAREYGAEVNCASESPQSLEISGGQLHQNDIFSALDTGLYISNLWYCNFSDRNHCRITGMTRFACLWVEQGRPVAPINVMRFDESIYRILGDCLEGLTHEQEQILDSSSYEWRSNASARLPGALVNEFTFTL